MELVAKESLKLDIYRQLMRVMEGKEPVPVSGIYTITIIGDGTKKELRFRRLLGLNNMNSVQSLDDPEFRIYYDPNWESMAKIDKLLSAGVPA